MLQAFYHKQMEVSGIPGAKGAACFFEQCMLKVAKCKSNAVAQALTAEVWLARGAAGYATPLLGVATGLVLLR